MWHTLHGLTYGRSLGRLAMFYGTDKGGDHDYIPHYQMHFAAIRKGRLRVLEIGIGGYNDPKSGGASLRMWRAYFPNAQIIGVDLHEKSWHREKRITTIQADQSDRESLRQLAEAITEVDIIIDDGSHVNSHVIATFETLFPLVRPGGFYAIEDTQTSYWSEFGGNPESHDDPHTTMGYFRKLVDEINRPEFRSTSGESSLVKDVVAFHFYHNLILLQKKGTIS